MHHKKSSIGNTTLRGKQKMLTNFSRALHSPSVCVRPDNEQELVNYVAQHDQQHMLVRGSGFSYNDSCLNTDQVIIDSHRLNHLVHFDPSTGILVCQGAVSFSDLFLAHPEFIPPVLPGTVYATVAGGIAHDVHGKNSHQAGSFGNHVLGFELLIGKKKYYCSREEHSDLFHATIAGLGLTGIILRVSLTLRKASRFVQVKHQSFTSLSACTAYMSTQGTEYDYQVAWLDLLHSTPRAIVSSANHCEPVHCKESRRYTIPPCPLRLIHAWSMRLFNYYFFTSHKAEEQSGLDQFNNPLDKIKHWNRLYGSQGLIQFQAVFGKERAAETIEHLLELIRHNKATPTLSVLKLLTQKGQGLLSFCQPGFTLAIDFINNTQGRKAIAAMNQFINELSGKIYLAKDTMLKEEQFKKMYEQHKLFSDTLSHYGCSMYSDLAKRLGIKK